VKNSLNFSTNEWYDPYTTTIKMFFRGFGNQQIPPLILKYFIRKNLKSSIMVTNYNATKLTFHKAFYEALRKNNPEINLTTEDYRLFKEWLRYLYTYVINDLFKDFFTKDKDEVVGSVDPKKVCVAGRVLNLEYLEPVSIEGGSKGREVYKVPRRYLKGDWPYLQKRSDLAKIPRSTYVKYQLTDNIDAKKTNQALSPNLIQALDANLNLLVVEKTPAYAFVHDCWGFMAHDMHIVKDLQNFYFNDANLDFSDVGFLKYKKGLAKDANPDYSIFVIL